MADEDASTVRDRQLLLLKASVGEATTAVAALDMALVMLVADIIHGPVMPRQDVALASLIVFNQSTVERRFDIVRKVLTLRLSGALEQKPHEYIHKVADFLIKGFNLANEAAVKDLWLRNTAAHGNYYMSDERGPTIVPTPFDLEGVQRFNQKRGMKRGEAFMPTNGITADELNAYARSLQEPQRWMNRIREIMILLQRGHDPAGFEAALVALGKDLKLSPPLQARPRREKKPQAQPK